MPHQKEDMWMHTYTHTEEDPYLFCLVLSCRQKYLIIQTRIAAVNWTFRRGPRFMVSAFPQMQGSCAPAHAPSYPLLMGMFCPAETRYLQKPGSENSWDLTCGKLLSFLGQADPRYCPGLGMPGLEVNCSPIAQESPLNSGKLLVKFSLSDQMVRFGLRGSPIQRFRR